MLEAAPISAPGALARREKIPSAKSPARPEAARADEGVRCVPEIFQIELGENHCGAGSEDSDDGGEDAGHAENVFFRMFFPREPLPEIRGEDGGDAVEAAGDGGLGGGENTRDDDACDPDRHVAEDEGGEDRIAGLGGIEPAGMAFIKHEKGGADDEKEDGRGDGQQDVGPDRAGGAFFHPVWSCNAAQRSGRWCRG